MTDSLSDLQRRYERLNLLYQVGNVIHSTLDPQQALDLILNEVVRLTRASSGSIVLINPNTGFLEIEAAHGLPPNARQIKLRVGEGVTGWVARTGKPARVGDVRKDHRYVMLRENIRSELAVPLYVEGELRGLVNVDSESLDALPRMTSSCSKNYRSRRPGSFTIPGCTSNSATRHACLNPSSA